MNLVLNYIIGRGHNHTTALKHKDCTSDITPGVILNNNNPISSNETYINTTHKSLIIAYSLNKNLITNSNIWNALFSTLELCERTQLLRTSYTGSNESMVIVEDT